MSFKRSFLNFSKKKIKFKFSCFHIFGQNVVTTFYLPISCFHIFGQNVATTLSFRLMTPKKISFSQRIYDVGFTTKYQRQKRPAFEVFFLYPYKEKGFLILSGSLIRNNSFSGGKFNRVVVEALSLWRESKYGVIISICYNGTLKPFSVHFN